MAPPDQEVASLALVSVVVSSCFLLSLLLALSCWGHLQASRPSYTYCVNCLNGCDRPSDLISGPATHRLGIPSLQRLGPGVQDLASSQLQGDPYMCTIDLHRPQQQPLDLQASTLSRSFKSASRTSMVRREALQDPQSELAGPAAKVLAQEVQGGILGEGQEGRGEGEGEAYDGRLGKVRLLVSPPACGSPRAPPGPPLSTTPANARGRSSKRRRGTVSLPPEKRWEETTDEEEVGRSGLPLVTRLLQQRQRQWSDPRKERSRGSPGHTATAGYMAEQQRDSPALEVEIDTDTEPQAAANLQVPRPYRPGYSESEFTSDDDLSRAPRPLAALQLTTPSPRSCSGASSQPQSLAWDNYQSDPAFPRGQAKDSH